MNESGFPRSSVSNPVSTRSHAERVVLPDTNAAADPKGKGSTVVPKDNAVTFVAKPKAVYLIPEEPYRVAYGIEEETALAELMTFVAPPLQAESWPQYKAVTADVEAIFTGWVRPPWLPRSSLPFLRFAPPFTPADRCRFL